MTGREVRRTVAVPPVMWVGAALTLFCALAPLADGALTEVISSHVREAYPAWDASTVAAESAAITGWLVAWPLLGLGGWALTIRAGARGRGWARPVSITLLAVAMLVGILNLVAGGGAYDVIVPAPFGALSLLPPAVGLIAVAQLGRQGPHPSPTGL